MNTTTAMIASTVKGSHSDASEALKILLTQQRKLHTYLEMH